MTACLTWADVKNDPDLVALSLNICASGVTMIREWVKPTMNLPHWQRIVEIAETAAHELGTQLGFSWVDLALVGDTVKQLTAPAHLQAVVAAHNQSVSAADTVAQNRQQIERIRQWSSFDAELTRRSTP